MYVEEEGTIVRKLYVTGFEKQDEGIYKCTGMIDGTLWEKSITVFLFSMTSFRSSFTLISLLLCLLDILSY